MKICVQLAWSLIGRHKHSIAQEGEKIMFYDDSVTEIYWEFLSPVLILYHAYLKSQVCIMGLDQWG